LCADIDLVARTKEEEEEKRKTRNAVRKGTGKSDGAEESNT
jgi:hypothetical protein